jgi:hypothetical protein
MKNRPHIRYQPQSAQGKAVFRIIFLFIAFATAFVLHVWLRTLVVAEGYRLGEARKIILKLEAERVKLRLQRERLISPDRLHAVVESLRFQGLDFQRPTPNQVYYYDTTEKLSMPEEIQVPAR